MGLRRFDRKFGADLLRDLPAEPAVYLFKDGEGRVLYAGKAKNIRRRLQSYRNAGRRKAHRKMRTLVNEASALEVRLQPDERSALLLENELIRRLRPPYNVDGTYSFLYPAIGTCLRGHQGILIFTTAFEAYGKLGPRWYGVFRSRLRAGEAFGSLVALLELLGHREPRSRLPKVARIRGSRFVAFRRIEEWMPGIERLLGGESSQLLPEIARGLLEKPDARRRAERVGEDLRRLEGFYRCDAQRLRWVLRAAGRESCFVPQEERDALFLAHGGR